MKKVFFNVLNHILNLAGFIIMQSDTHINTDQGVQFQGVSMIIQKIAEVNLDILPEWLQERVRNLQFADRVRTFQMRK